MISNAALHEIVDHLRRVLGDLEPVSGYREQVERLDDARHEIHEVLHLLSVPVH